MWQQYAPEPRMRLNLGIRRRLAPLLDRDKRKWFLLNALFLSLPGAPIIYYGDEIGMGDNIWLPDRHGCRTPMQWDASANAGFSDAAETYLPVNDDYPQVNVAAQEADPDSYLNLTRFLIRTRQSQPALRNGTFEWLETGNDAVLAYVRRLQGEWVLCLYNLSDKTQTLPGDFLNVSQPLHDLLHPGQTWLDNVRVCANEPHEWELPPFACHWFRN